MKTPQIVFALFLLIILVSTGSHAQSVYYVSHSTSLKEDGSQAYPYHSIHRAIEKAKEDKNSVTIYLREGKYILDKPIVLTPENSCDSKTLTIKAYPEEKRCFVKWHFIEPEVGEVQKRHHAGKRFGKSNYGYAHCKWKYKTYGPFPQL